MYKSRLLLKNYIYFAIFILVLIPVINLHAQDTTLTVTSTGNIGIGTTSPTEKLVVGDDFGIKLSGTRITIGNANGASALNLGTNFDNRAFLFWDPANKHLAIGTSAEGNLFGQTLILKNGRVGMGIATPEEKLQVNGFIYSMNGGFKFPDGTLQTTAAATNGQGGGTLDQAYDYGGPGAGRIITADAGAFEVAGNGGVLFSGGLNSGEIPFEGEGTRMMWYPAKAALRAGRTTGNNWNADSIGFYSLATGFNTRASGQNSTAFGSYSRAISDNSTALGYLTLSSGEYALSAGWGSIATAKTATAIGSECWAQGPISFATGSVTAARGVVSTAMGFATQANGNYSTAMGNQTLASGENSTSLGNNTEASGENATAMGNNTTASGINSTAFGSGSNASGDYATGMGLNTTASGSYSTAMGNVTEASGSISTAMGSGTIASGDFSTAMGLSTIASGDYSTALGRNVTAAGLNSIAMGSYIETSGTGSFVIGDYSTTEVLTNSENNRFDSRFSNGYFLYTNSTATIGAALTAGSNSWAVISDSTKKENFKVVNGEEVLNKISNFKLSSWNYKSQDKNQFRHYGPMAQDFYNAFGNDGIGTIGNDTTISSADFDGINLIAIQALEKRTTEIENLKNEIEALKEKNIELNQKLVSINDTLQKLEILFSAIDDQRKENEKNITFSTKQ